MIIVIQFIIEKIKRKRNYNQVLAIDLFLENKRIFIMIILGFLNIIDLFKYDLQLLPFNLPKQDLTLCFS